MGGLLLPLVISARLGQQPQPVHGLWTRFRNDPSTRAGSLQTEGLYMIALTVNMQHVLQGCSSKPCGSKGKGSKGLKETFRVRLEKHHPI